MVGVRRRAASAGEFGVDRGGLRRREFLRLAAAGAAALACPALACPAGVWAGGEDPFADLTVIDIHAHPTCGMARGKARVEDMRPGGLSAACFSAVGDRVWARGIAGTTEYASVQEKLHSWLDGPVARGELGLVRCAADVPGPGAARPGAILGLEGGDPLEGRVERVDEFYALGVRVITLVHYRNNELGDIMHSRTKDPDPGPFRHGLSPAGRAVVARMEERGMLVDVAHTSSETLRDILAVARHPVVDSHTGICHRERAEDFTGCGRNRSWEEMEWVARAGGVVCIWVKGVRDGSRGFAAWAVDIMALRDRLGPQAVGLGTDSGGNLGAYVAGYSGWRDLRPLGTALTAAGMSRADLAAFFGGNVQRVLRQCLG